jgi:hypothetical protein
VAARVTEASGLVRLVTLAVTVAPPPPTVTVPNDMTVNAGDTVTLQADASDPNTIASVQWQFSFDGGDFVTDPSLTTLTPTYTFADFGEYDVLVQVTDTNGTTGENSFHVSVNEVTPTATGVRYSGPMVQFSGSTITSGSGSWLFQG